MATFMNNKPNLMFHEILDDDSIKSGWHLESKGKYTITTEKFREILDKYGDTVNYTFDDGGISNYAAALELKKRRIRGIFFISTNFVNQSGFLDMNQIKDISDSHFIFSHGHNHLMNTFDFKELMMDWTESLNFMKIHGFETGTICLPGGSISQTHLRVLESLGVKNIYHSAPRNTLINLLYKTNIVHFPRVIVDMTFEEINFFDFAILKTYVKQLLNFRK